MSYLLTDSEQSKQTLLCAVFLGELVSTDIVEVTWSFSDIVKCFADVL